MPIRVAQRATISDHFIDGLKAVSRRKLKEIKEQADRCYSDRMRQRVLNDHAGAIAYHQKLLKDPKALDHELTKLRSLPYAAYGAVDRCGEIFLHGQTKEVVMASGRNKWRLGAFDVYLRVQENGRFEKPTMLLAGDPWLRKTHPHFTVSHASNDPLDARMSICWGSFGPIISGLVRDANIPEYFRTLYMYLSRYNPSSPLGGGVESCLNAVEVQ
jgi:hypothetical protein